MQLSSANVNVSNTLYISDNNMSNAIPDIMNFTLGSVTVNSSQVSIGSNVVSNSSGLFVPLINLSGTNFDGIYNLTTFGAIVNTQIFSTTGWNLWTKPTGNATLTFTGNEQVLMMMWGGGGGATANSSRLVGGGGGACVITTMPLSQLNATCNVYVGSGGNGTAIATLNPAHSGQTSVFWVNTTVSVSAYGGAGGSVPSASLQFGGGGGGYFSVSVSNTGNGGDPLGGTAGSTGAVSTFGGGGGANNTTPYTGGASIFGGGGGGGYNGGASIYGGAGGSGQNTASISVFGGRGGNGSSVAGVVPGGGGGAGGSVAGAGANGQIRVWVIK